MLSCLAIRSPLLRIDVLVSPTAILPSLATPDCTTYIPASLSQQDGYRRRSSPPPSHLFHLVSLYSDERQQGQAMSSLHMHSRTHSKIVHTSCLASTPPSHQETPPVPPPWLPLASPVDVLAMCTDANRMEAMASCATPPDPASMCTHFATCTRGQSRSFRPHIPRPRLRV